MRARGHIGRRQASYRGANSERGKPKAGSSKQKSESERQKRTTEADGTSLRTPPTRASCSQGRRADRRDASSRTRKTSPRSQHELHAFPTGHLPTRGRRRCIRLGLCERGMMGAPSRTRQASPSRPPGCASPALPAPRLKGPPSRTRSREGEAAARSLKRRGRPHSRYGRSMGCVRQWGPPPACRI